MKFEPDAWTMHRSRFGELDCYLVVPTKAPPRLLLSLCHGFGAPGSDLVPLFDDLLYYLPEGSAPFAFLCPAGPVDLEEAGLEGGRAWWPLNMALLMQMAATNSFDQMRDTIPPGLDSARSALVRCIRESLSFLSKECSCDQETPIMLGGFSQGAMLATDTLFRGELENVVGLAAFSGALICESTWKQSMSKAATLPYIQSHGLTDTVLPFQTGKWLNELLAEAGMQGGLLQFDGPHTIPSEAIMQLAKLVHTLTLAP